MIRCPGCTNMIASLCDHEPGCLVLKLETQDTEPLSPDAARIVELERRILQLELRLEVEVRANDSAIRLAGTHSGKLRAQLRQQEPVMKAALELGRQWAKGSSMTSGDYANLHHLNALAAAVAAFDALQPKG